MNQKEIEEAQKKLDLMNAIDKQFQRELVDADIKVAEAQKAAADAVVKLKSAAADRDLLTAKRNKNKSDYGELYEQVGSARKAIERAEAEKKASKIKAH